MSVPPKGRGARASQPGEGRARKKSQVSPVRNFVGGFALVAFVAIGFLEWSANRGYNAATVALDKALEKDQGGGLLSLRDVNRITGREPDGPLAGPDGCREATYTWRGLVRTYTLRAYFTGRKEPRLLSISTGEEEAK